MRILKFISPSMYVLGGALFVCAEIFSWWYAMPATICILVASLGQD